MKYSFTFLFNIVKGDVCKYVETVDNDIEPRSVSIGDVNRSENHSFGIHYKTNFNFNCNFNLLFYKVPYTLVHRLLLVFPNAFSITFGVLGL